MHAFLAQVFQDVLMYTLCDSGDPNTYTHPEPSHLSKVSGIGHVASESQEQARCQILVACSNNASRLPVFKRVAYVWYVRSVPTSDEVSVTFRVPAPSDFSSTSNALASHHRQPCVAVRCNTQPTVLSFYPRTR